MAKKQVEAEAKVGEGVAFRYVGKGWIPGVPARDLTWEEAEELGLEIIRHVLDPHTGELMYEELPSDMRLDSFGISAAAVKEKIEEVERKA